MSKSTARFDALRARMMALDVSTVEKVPTFEAARDQFNAAEAALDHQCDLLEQLILRHEEPDR